MLTQIHTDIGCSECLEEVRQAIGALSSVESVKEDASRGDFIVSHSVDREFLKQVVLETGHRLEEAENGEIEMVPASVSLFDACPHYMAT
jgi:copper chaperone CopZ